MDNLYKILCHRFRQRGGGVITNVYGPHLQSEKHSFLKSLEGPGGIIEAKDGFSEVTSTLSFL
jgi:hypothetical protein